MLRVLLCQIQHNMESFGSITRTGRLFTEAATFFLSLVHNADGAAEKTRPKAKTDVLAATLALKQRGKQNPRKPFS